MGSLCLRTYNSFCIAFRMQQEASRLFPKIRDFAMARMRLTMHKKYFCSALTVYHHMGSSNPTRQNKQNLKKETTFEVAKFANRCNFSVPCAQTVNIKQKRHFSVLHNIESRWKQNWYHLNSRKILFSPLQGKTRFRNLMTDKNNSQSENIFTIPNVLSMARISLAPVIGYCILNFDYSVALGLLGLAGVTDVLDGFIARNFKNQSSVFGSMLDPVADKVLMSIMTVCLTWVNLLPVQLCVLIIGRDIGLIMAVAYLRYKTLPEPMNLSRYFDFNLPTVQMKPTQISKYNTTLQLGLVGLCLAAPVFGFLDSTLLHAYWYLVGTTTVLAGLSYVANEKTFKVIKQKRK